MNMVCDYELLIIIFKGVKHLQVISVLQHNNIVCILGSLMYQIQQFLLENDFPVMCFIGLCGAFIPCILACKVAQDHGESCCLPFLPGAMLALRTSIRNKYSINVSSDTQPELSF